MANNITLAQKYLPILDEVYKASARASILDAQDVRFINANTVQLFKMSMDGLGNYNRSTGFVTGDVEGSWEDMVLTQDRGRAFIIDSMDNEETIGMAFGKLAGEFIRTKVAPEIDAYTFATLAGTANIGTASAADVSVGSTDVPVAIEAATEAMDKEEVPDDGRIIFISEKCYNALKAKVTRSLANEGSVNTNVETYNGMRIIRVPQARFNTKITLYNGTSEGQETGGFIVPASSSYKINFLMVHPSAIVKVAKHVLPRIFSPQQYQQADAWKFDYRIYHDVFVEENKVKGIYLHRASTANS
jgi:hypothetical protein